MRIHINGKARDISPDQSLHDLILSLQLDPSVVVAELNRAIVPGADFNATALHDGDRLELLSFVGGG